jgi:hypothetical protein
VSAESVRPRRGRHPLLACLLSARLAAAAAAAVTLGSAAAAAYAGVLPASIRKLAHDTFGGPSAHRSAHPAVPEGPSATDPAAHGLCTAYAHLKEDGSAGQKAVVFRRLAAAVGGAANVTAYCAPVGHPGAIASSKPTSHPTGKPTSQPSGKPTSQPSTP